MGIELLQCLQMSRNLGQQATPRFNRGSSGETYAKATSKFAEKTSLLLEIMINQHVYAIALRLLVPLHETLQSMDKASHVTTWGLKKNEHTTANGITG